MKAPATCSCKPSRKWNWVYSLLFLALQANALTDSQYHVATEPNHLLLDSVDHWDAESASDCVTYQRPLEWEGQWLREKKVFDLSVGSISSKQFLTYQRLKIHHMLTNKLEFRLHWLEERDYEQDRMALPLELRYQFTHHFALAVFGRPSLYKSEDDIGAAVALKPSAEREIQAAVLWGDFQRNQKNLNSDSWSEPPVAYTLTSTYIPATENKDFRRTEMHYEPNSTRSLAGSPVSTLGYQMISLSGLNSRDNGYIWSYRLLMDKSYHEDHGANLIRIRTRVISQLECAWYHGPYQLKPGLNYSYRQNQKNQGQDIAREILPTFWFQFPETPKSWGAHTLSIGYDATVFKRDSTLQPDQNKIEHRGNVRSSMKFNRAGELALLLTFDLDRFGSGETWEGGAAQFRLDF